ncbi:MAG: cytochrome C [Geopsychrobacter sp.]|nr:cytochrome C [Geopsychrobacter sp.]
MTRYLLTVMGLTLLWCTPALAVDFNHTEHLTYLDEADCATCHIENAPEIVPADAVCLKCHDQGFVDSVVKPSPRTHGLNWPTNHRPFAKSKKIDCSACHQQSFCLDCHKSGFADEMGDLGNNMINVHRGEFQVSHPIAARTNPQLCVSCHEPDFCSECHARFAPADLAVKSHRRGWSDLSAGSSGPAHETFTTSQCQNCHTNSVVFNGNWSGTHAREARKNLATCQACHPQGDICLKCHSARSGLRINPHPKDWDDISGRLNRASGGKTCRRCH